GDRSSLARVVMMLLGSESPLRDCETYHFQGQNPTPGGTRGCYESIAAGNCVSSSRAPTHRSLPSCFARYNAASADRRSSFLCCSTEAPGVVCERIDEMPSDAVKTPWRFSAGSLNP